MDVARVLLVVALLLLRSPALAGDVALFMLTEDNQGLSSSLRGS